MNRLRDFEADWGLTPDQYAKREKAKLRERDRRRRERPRNDLGRFVPAIVPKLVGEVWPLTSPDGIELGICCIARYTPNRTALGGVPLTAKGEEGSDITLPFVSFLYGAKPA